MPEIQWINHASFVLRHGAVALICDPWLEGTAFDDGWSLLSQTRFTFEDFEGITHIWFSHEHPDHFSPPNIMRIPERLRRGITVLFQTTADGKVAAFCREAGFSVVEMPNGKWMPISDGVSVLCQPHKDGDSMLAIRTPNHTILNLNDCIVRKLKAAEAVRAVVGSVDVLLTQFSYANWEGNPEDVAARKRSAAEKLQRMQIQIDALKPAFVVPFASFVWFSHEENAYMNDAINRVGDVAAMITRHTAASSVVLYPGDVWTVGEDHDSEPAILSYGADYETIPRRRLSQSEMVPISELKSAAESFVGGLLKANHPLLRFLLRPADIFVEDHSTALHLAPSGLKPSYRSRESCDIALSSAALAYCFRNPWGGGTLMVNGRFTSPPNGNLERFRSYLKISERNNHGRRIGMLTAIKLWRKSAG